MITTKTTQKLLFVFNAVLILLITFRVILYIASHFYGGRIFKPDIYRFLDATFLIALVYMCLFKLKEIFWKKNKEA